MEYQTTRNDSTGQGLYSKITLSSASEKRRLLILQKLQSRILHAPNYESSVTLDMPSLRNDTQISQEVIRTRVRGTVTKRGKFGFQEMNSQAEDEKFPGVTLAGVAQWIERRLRTKGLLVQFLVRAHAWVAGQVPSGGHMRGDHALIFLSLSFSLPSPLSKNK